MLGRGDVETMAGQFFSLLMGDLMVRLMLGVAPPPKPAEIRKRAAAATAAVLALHAADASAEGSPQRGGRK